MKAQLAHEQAIQTFRAKISAENTARKARKTVSTFRHVERPSNGEALHGDLKVIGEAPVCRYNTIYNKATRFAIDIHDPLDCVYESKYMWQLYPGC